MKRLLIVLSIVFSLLTVFGQQMVTLTFTGRDANDSYCQLNRVVITNLTKSWQETIYWPDTVLTMQHGTGIEDYEESFVLFQNNPNPFYGTTEANLNMVESGEVTMQIMDISGRMILESSNVLSAGSHKFRIQIVNAGVYFLTARQNNRTFSIKMINNGQGTKNSVEYVGEETMAHTLSPTKGNSKGNTENPFSFGDQMEYVGYATINGAEIESQRIQQMQGASQTFELQFNAVQPQSPTVTTLAVTDITDTTAFCGGNVIADGGANVIARGVCWSMNQNPTIADEHTTDGSGIGGFTSNITGLSGNTTYYVRAYATNSVGTAYGPQQVFTTESTFTCGISTITDVDGNNYNTVHIGQQCWMAENLRTTKYADSTDISLGIIGGSSNTTAYRYYPNGDSINVNNYGYLYNWQAVKHNSSPSSSNPSGVQGICPTGWHVPSNAEWTQLITYVSNQSQYVCGSDSTYIAKSLASTTGWNNSTISCAVGNTPSDNNATGFSAVPAGYLSSGVYFYWFGSSVMLWSSTLFGDDAVWYLNIDANSTKVLQYYATNTSSKSVRCLRD